MAKKYNCTKNGVQYFRKTKTIGHKADGTAIKKEFYGDGEKDCLAKIDTFMNFIKNGVPADFFSITIEQLMHTWLFEVLLHSVNVASASFEKHETNYRLYIKNSQIGFLTVYDIVSLPIQKYYTKAYTEGITVKSQNEKTEIKKLSSEKIFDLNKTLRKFFNWAISQHYLQENPCSLKIIEIPGNSDGEEDEDEDELEGNNIQAFSDDELNTILKNIKYENYKDNTFNVAVHLDFITGLRKGELFGLKKKFVDLEACKIKVVNTLGRVKIFESPTKYTRKLKLKRLKSRTSIRTISFPKYFKNILQLYFEEQEQKYKKNGLEFNDDSLLFTTNTCNPIEYSNFGRSWERFLKRFKIAYKKIHSIRDTYATLLIRNGAKIHDVKKMLGHSSITITEKYYIFVFPEDLEKTASLLDYLEEKCA